jgi:hypothetical protein
VPSYSNRFPAAVAQPVPITLSLASSTSIVDLVANSTPFASSSRPALTLCDPRKTPVAL